MVAESRPGLASRQKRGTRALTCLLHHRSVSSDERCPETKQSQVYNQHQLSYSITMYGIFLIAVNSTAIHTFLYFSVSEIQLQHVKELAQIPDLAAVKWIDCSSLQLNNSYRFMSGEIWCYKTTIKDKEGGSYAFMACGNYQRYDDTCFIDCDLSCHGETRRSKITGTNVKYKHTCDVMCDNSVVNFADSPLQKQGHGDHVIDEVACHHETLAFKQTAEDEEDLYCTRSQTCVDQLCCSVLSNACFVTWPYPRTSMQDQIEDKRGSMIKMRVKTFKYSDHQRHQSGFHSESSTGNGTLSDNMRNTITTVVFGKCVFLNCPLCFAKHTCCKYPSSMGFVCRHKTCHNQDSNFPVKCSAKKCNMKRQACEKCCNCFQRCSICEGLAECHNTKCECVHKYCIHSVMEQTDIDNRMYVNLLCVILFLFCLFSDIEHEVISILKWHYVAACYHVLYCNPCSQFKQNIKKKNFAKWKRENISKQKEKFTWLPTISKLLCLESQTSKSSELFRFSDVSNDLYNIEFHTNKAKDDIMSVLFELHTDFISVPQVFAYSLLSTLNHYLTRVQNEGNVLQDEEMCYEVRRLQSFSSAPVRTSPMRLARSGFYATGSRDETRCYSCKMTHSNWRLMDQPDQIHRSVSPDCPHLNRVDQRNVPIWSCGSDNDDATRVCGVIGEYTTVSGSSETMASQTLATTTIPAASGAAAAASPSAEISSPELAGLDISKAVYPQYRDLSRRLDSYKGWGSSHVQDHQVLARAGFYYAGYRDCVRCFYCGVGLRTWEREDDPWVEHVRWRSSCDYVRLMRGEQFVIQALANGLSVASSPFPPTAQNQTQNTVVTVKADGADATVKAEEMGFQRHLIERAVLELTTSQNISRGSVPLETLMEKLLVLNDPQTSASSISPSLNNNSTTFTPPLEQSTIPPSTKQQLSNEHQRTASATVTSSVRASADDSMSASITRQKAVGVVQQGTNTNADKTDQESNTGGVEKETEGLSDNQERQLEEENQSLRDESTCKICLDNPSCIVFLPCGHLVTCAECAPALRKCPICRALIRGTVRAHTVSSEDMQM